MIKNKKTTIALAASAALTAGLTLSPMTASADTNPFASAELSNGYMQLAEGNCGANKDAEAKCGANKKHTLFFSMHAFNCSSVRCNSMPACINKSALPLRLDTEWLPCLATRAPALLATILLMVDMLNVFLPSPPVPTMSIRLGPRSMQRAKSSMIVAAVDTSSTVSPFIRIMARKTAICTSDNSPVIHACMISVISAAVRFFPASRCSKSLVVFIVDKLRQKM